MANEFDNHEQLTDPFPLVTPSEQDQPLEEWTKNETDYPKNATIHELFQLQAAKTPDKVAIAYKNQKITYYELDKKSNQLAHYLQQIGVKQETLVPVYLERSPNLIITILAILKAGGAYLPLDTSAPLARIETILEDANTSILITQKPYLNTIKNLSHNLNCIDIDNKAILENFPDNYAPESAINGDNLAYVMYTSGSTGKPKGVCVVHRGVVRLVKNNNYANFNENEIILQLASIAFDAATFEIWQPLLNGGKLVLLPEKNPSLQDIGKAIKQYNVTTLWLTSGFFNLFVEEHIDYLKPLNKLLAGGDILSIPHVKRVLEELPHCQLINGYGPTENTTFTCCHTITIDDTKKASIPIGRPIANTQVYILDEKLEIVPIGVVGELYIGGDGLARGYLNQPQLTKEKFIKNPFNNAPNSRLYKTGDLVRWNEEGTIEFLGRIDFQVKIRGYRIELGEIETVLNQHSAVKISKVIVREDIPGDKQLIAYIILSSSQTNIAEIYHEIRDYLQQQLPNYMTPAAFVALDSFPLNINGKIDYRALPAPDFSAVKSYYVAPRNPTEEILVNIWSQVLKIENIGINDNFFELGGHSLLGTQVISRLREILNVEIPIALLFQYPTIAQFCQHITRRETTNNNLLIEPIQPRQQEKNIPLSFTQKRLWFLNQLDKNNTAYNLLYRFRLQGLVNVNALEKSFDEISKRHEILRTNCVSVNGKITQIIKNNKFDLPIIDLQQFPDEDRETEAEKIAKQEANYPFNLSQDCLFRVQLIRLNHQEHQLLFNIHHIIFDGWSFGVLFTELKLLYTSYCQDSTSPLLPLPIQYADFTLWQKNNLTEKVLEPQLNYWKKQLSGTLPILELPTDYARSKIQTYKGATKTFLLSSKLTASIKAFSRREGVTIFMTLLAAFKVLLGRYSGQEDMIVGTAIAGRKRQELESLIGFFVNTLALRSHLSEHLSFRELLNQIRQVCLDAYAHQDVPFEQLVETLQPERNLSHHPIFQVMFVLQNTEIEALQLPDLEIKSLETARQAAKFDLTLSLEEHQGKLRGEWEYNTDLFDSSTIKRISEHFQILLSSILTNPQENVWQLPLLTEREKQQLLIEWNQTNLPYPKHLCLHQLFEAQVKKAPNSIALIFEKEEISYQQLNQKANQLAHYLSSLGVQSETLVGLLLHRSPTMIIAMLAILKAGGTYVPLDVNYPQERLLFILEDCQISLLLTESSLENILGDKNQSIPHINLNKVSLKNYSEYNLENRVKSDDLSYIIYTSGSTGKPKGVAIKHHSPVALVYWAKETFSPQQLSGVLASTSICFDLSIFEIFVTLSCGGSIILLENALELPQLFHQTKVTLINTVPSIISKLIEINGIPKSVKTVILAGEPLQANIINQLYQINTIESVYNCYGPSEDTTYSTYELIGKEITSNPSIGRPILNTKIYILDKHLNPVPCGVSGELYIGGDGLARGYFNRPELTQQKFIDSPFEPEQKLYKTGDLAYYKKDGKIEFLGRIDNQVKIRGFRIELGEIETVLNQYFQIKEAKVTSRQDEQQFQQLVAYIILNTNQIFGTEIYHEIREYLQEKLPPYMIPAAFVILDFFPLTPSGKIDYRALPTPDFSDFQSNYVAPRTPIEEIITNIWKQVLGLENIGINDNFFELGGHSLLGTQIISRIRDSLKIEIPLKLLFECPTVSQLSEHIDLNKKVNHTLSLPPIVPRQKQENLPLSFSQEGLWFLTQLDPNSTAYNMPFIIEIKGLLNISVLEKSINKIIERHEILRTNFISINGQPTQIINPNVNLKLLVHDLRNIANEQKKAEAKKRVYQFIEQPFNLAKDTLFSVKLLHLDSESYWLLFNIHHIIFDGWSYQLLKEELFTLYQAYNQEKSPEILPISIQYADFSLWQRHWFIDKNLEFQLTYWKKQLKGTLPTLKLPIDFPRPPVQTYKGDSYSWHLSSELTTKIKCFCQQEGVTLFMTFLTVFKILISRYTAEKDIIIGTPIASRNRTEIENLIGFFINTVALRTNLGENPSFRELLARVQQVTLDAYAHQDLPFEQLVKELKPERNLSYNPIFQVWFNLINLPKNEISCDSLQIKSIPIIETMAKFDLSFYVEEENQKIKLKFVYNKLLFKSNTIERIGKHFQRLLEQVIIAPENQISSFSLLSEKERYQLNHQRNKVSPTNSFLNFPKIAIEQSIPSRFEQQVNKYSDKIAVQSKDTQYTYHQLNSQANKIAQYLLNTTANKQVKVALFFDHNVSMIAAIMGVLKASQIYVPLDPNYPQDRISYILDDSCAEVILTNHKNLGHVKAITKEKIPIINIDELNDVAINIHLDIPPDILAYILYTSGSTGKPKGVIQNHRNVLHFIRNHTNNLHISADDNLILLASYSFDAAVIDIFSALLNGATLSLFDIKQEGLSNLSDWLQTQKITIYHSTPTVYRYFLEILDNKESRAKTQLSQIRLVILGGESVVRKDVELYQSLFADYCLFVNGLGATECSFYLQYLIDKTMIINQKSVPAGYGFEDTEIILLDEDGNITDICGEIAIQSPYIALGYWQKEDLTKAVFLENFQGKNQRVYRTGDWGYLRNNGLIECLGRKDFQVKIRGFRIELGEIEAVLKEHNQIKETVVIAQENMTGEQELIAYIILENNQLLRFNQSSIIQQIKQDIKAKLPDYMIPMFRILEAFPLTPNGKINRLALSTSAISDFHENELDYQQNYPFLRLYNLKKVFNLSKIRPRLFSRRKQQISNELELYLLDIWEKILRVRPIGLNDNFFDLGGYSLLAIRLLARIEQDFKIDIPLYTFFNNPNISSLVNLIQQSQDSITESSIVPIQPNGNKLPLFFVNSINYAQKLASYLDKDQPFYILNVFGITDFLTPRIDQLTLEEIAAKFIEDMEKVAPNSPYFLITYCGDLSLTIELVRQLEDKGVEIPCIFLIDSFWKPQDLGFYLHWHNLRQFGINYLVEKIRNNLSYKRENLIIFVNRILGKFYFSNQNNSSRYMRDLNLLKALKLARTQYTPQPSQVKVILFLSQEYRLLKTSQLNEFLTEVIEVEEIPGYHHTLFQEPYIQKFTQKLQEYLKNNNQ